MLVLNSGFTATDGAIFYSCVVKSGSNGNAIVTLHWILSDAETTRVVALCSTTLEADRELADLTDRLFNTAGLVSDGCREYLRPIWDAMMAVRTDSATLDSVNLLTLV
jgi:hypothetical protein